MSSMQVLTAVTLVAGFTGGYAVSEMGVLQLSPEQWDGVIIFFGTMMAGFLIVKLVTRLMVRKMRLRLLRGNAIACSSFSTLRFQLT